MIVPLVSMMRPTPAAVAGGAAAAVTSVCGTRQLVFPFSSTTRWMRGWPRSNSSNSDASEQQRQHPHARRDGVGGDEGIVTHAFAIGDGEVADAHRQVG